MGFFRKVIHIAAEDSPNVQLGLAQVRAGMEPTGALIIPGVLPWHEYQKRLATWDPVAQCIGLHGRFYKGAELLLFPPHWLNFSNQRAAALQRSNRQRQAKGIGIDPGEGTAESAMAAVDEYGLIELVAYPTPDTNVIPHKIVEFMLKHQVAPHQIIIDRGGGGVIHAHRLRAGGIFNGVLWQGLNIRTLDFAGKSQPVPKRRRERFDERIELVEEKTGYVNVRAQLYAEFSDLVDPSNPEVKGWGIPVEYVELRRQLAAFPKRYDHEGRLKLPPKNRRGKDSTEETLTQILGCSPDQSDATALAIHAMLHPGHTPTAGAAW